MTISKERLEKTAKAYHRVLTEFCDICEAAEIPVWEDLTPELQNMVREFANRCATVDKTGTQSIPENPPGVPPVQYSGKASKRHPARGKTEPAPARA